MSLTPLQKLDLLYKDQSRPIPVDDDIADRDLISMASDTTKARTNWNHQNPKQGDRLQPSGPSPSSQQAGCDSSDTDDSYVRSCRAAAKKLTQSNKSGLATRNKPTQAKKKDPYPAFANATASSDQDSESKAIDKPCDSPIAPIDRFGNPLLSKYCLLSLIAVFPYKFVPKAWSDIIAREFFDQGKIWKTNWQIYYIYPPLNLDTRPVLLVPFAQFQVLIDNINHRFKGGLVIPTDPSLSFTLPFYDDGTPQPRLLGIGEDRDHIKQLESTTIRPSPNHGEAPPNSSRSVELSFEAFREKIGAAIVANKRKGKTSKTKSTQTRMQQQLGWLCDLKRAQRYLGLRPRALFPAGDLRMNKDASWEEEMEYHWQKARRPDQGVIPFDHNRVAPYAFENEPVIISIDVESNERNHRQITEIGISTLDTLDIKDIPPGKSGCDWRHHIRSRHFRIREHAYIRNKDFCPGNPLDFRFGQSEIVSSEEVCNVIDSCFQWPFSVHNRHATQHEAAKGLEEPQLNTLLMQSDLGTTIPSSNDTSSAMQRIWEPETEQFRGMHLEETAKEIQSAGLSQKNTLPEPSDEKSSEQAPRKATTNMSESVTQFVSGMQEQKGQLERKIILVGHNIAADIRYFRQLASAIVNPDWKGPNGKRIYPNIIESLDTALLYQASVRQSKSPSLASILAKVGIPGWGLHNAGNDARYTMEVFLTLAIEDRLHNDLLAKSSDKEVKRLDRDWEDNLQGRVASKARELGSDARREHATWGVAPSLTSQAGPLKQSQDLQNQTDPWLVDAETLRSLQNSKKDYVDGGSPAGWHVAEEQQQTTKNRPKKSEAAKRRELENAYLEYMREQENRQQE